MYLCLFFSICCGSFFCFFSFLYVFFLKILNLNTGVRRTIQLEWKILQNWKRLRELAAKSFWVHIRFLYASTIPIIIVIIIFFYPLFVCVLDSLNSCNKYSKCSNFIWSMVYYRHALGHKLHTYTQSHTHTFKLTQQRDKNSTMRVEKKWERIELSHLLQWLIVIHGIMLLHDL